MDAAYVAGKDSRMKNFGGCDAGSTYTKCVIIDENGKILAAVTKRSRINPVLSAKDALDEAVSQVDGLNSAEELTYLIGMGYGRRRLLISAVRMLRELRLTLMEPCLILR